MPFSDEHYRRITDHLAQLYGQTLYQHDGQSHPLIVFPPAPEQAADVDSVLGPLHEGAAAGDESFAFYDRDFLRSLQNSGRNLYNAPTYILHDLQAAPLRISARVGHYYDMVATCIALENELWAAAAGDLLHLPNRGRLHAEVPPQDVLHSGRGRSAALGIATLIVFKHGAEYRAMLARRSRQAATDPLAYHTLPAMIFQPMGPQPAQEWSVSHQIYRELLEELFGMPEPARPQRADYFYQHPALLELRAMLADGRAGLYLTGITLNLLTTRAEICTLLLIHDPDWYGRSSSPAAAHPLRLEAETADGQAAFIPLKGGPQALPEPDLHLHMPPQGYAALMLGLEAARRYTNSP